MAKLTRATQQVFAGSATNNGVFGSLQAGSGQYSNDVATIQSLPAYAQGWNSATISSELLPPLEEFQGLQYVSSYQLAYIFQEGIPEWDLGTTYYQGSVVKVYSSSGTLLYSSLTNDNIGNDPTTSTSNWVQFGSLPDQTGNSGKFLTTDGSQASWANVDLSGCANTDLSNVSSNIDYIVDSGDNYVVFHSGMVIQWGYESSRTAKTITMPHPFATSDWRINLTLVMAAGGGGTGTPQITQSGVKTTTSVSVSFPASTSNYLGCEWIAIGKGA